MRVLFVSTHVDQITGYSKVAFNLLRQMASLRPKIKLFHFGFQRHPGRIGHRKVPEGVISYDAAAAEDPKEEGFGFNKLQEYIETVEPNLVLIYNDPLIIARFLDSIKYDKEKASFKVWAYVDQVYAGIAQPLMDLLDKQVDTIYTFTPFWKTMYESYFPEGPKSKVKVLGHAADAEVFKPVPNAKSSRSSFGITEDRAVVILNCNRNSERKRLDLTIQGFVQLLARDPEKPYYLMMVTGADPQRGAFYDLRRIFYSECTLAKLDLAQVGHRLVIVDTSAQTVFTDESINQIYNMADLGINTSDGEGYGLCQLEHLQTGAPQIVTNVGSYTFLDEECAVILPTPYRRYHSAGLPLGLFGNDTTAEIVGDGMARAIENLPKLRSALAGKTFPTWADVCDGFLEDLLAQAKN